MPADSAVPVDAPQTSIESIPDSESTTPDITEVADAADLMARFDIPDKLREKFLKEPGPEPETPEPEQTPEAISLEPDPEPEPEPEEEVAAEDDDEIEDKVDHKPASPEVAKLQKRNYKLRQRARRAEDEAATLKQKLESVNVQAPVTVVPTMSDPLAHINTLEELRAETKQFEIMRDTAEDNPDGWIANEGTPQEVVVDREKAKQWRRYAQDVLTKEIPRKEKEIADIRPKSIASAKQILPTMFEQGTEDYNAYQTVLRQYPFIATHPERESLVALQLLGWKYLMTLQGKQKEAEKDGIPDKILKAAEQREKVPVQKQTPPGRATVPAVSPSKKKTEILAKLQRAGGDRDSMLEALNAYGSNGNGNGSRDRVPV